MWAANKREGASKGYRDSRRDLGGQGGVRQKPERSVRTRVGSWKRVGGQAEQHRQRPWGRGGLGCLRAGAAARGMPSAGSGHHGFS